jgi:hypothetical protein
MSPHVHALDRYERDDAGVPCIDVAAENVTDLYSYFDRFSPHLRRDLEQDLVDYLIACAEEIHPAPFVVRFSFPRAADEEWQQRIHHSMNSFFTYLLEKERQTLKHMLYRSGVFLVVGLVILSTSVILEGMPESDSVWFSVVSQGVNIAAWISMWEALATFLVDWFPHRRKMRLYHSLASAKLQFQVQDLAGAQHS